MSDTFLHLIASYFWMFSQYKYKTDSNSSKEVAQETAKTLPHLSLPKNIPVTTNPETHNASNWLLS